MKLVIKPDGYIEFLNTKLRCALGRGGLSNDKREGDGATPTGEYLLGRVFYRADRLSGVPETGLNLTMITKNMGWCDDPDHPDYNRLITLPHPAHHETLWRDDPVYDVVVEILHNTNPVVPHHGSAIFMHVAKPDYTPTEGCIALSSNDLLDLLRVCNVGDSVVIPNAIP